MKRIILTLALLAVALLLPACATIENAGLRTTRVTFTADGKGCNYESIDGKEQKNRKEDFDGKNCTLKASADEDKAVASQKQAVKALSMMQWLTDMVSPPGQ